MWRFGRGTLLSVHTVPVVPARIEGTFAALPQLAALSAADSYVRAPPVWGEFGA